MADNAFVYKIDFTDSDKSGFLIQPGTTDVSTSLRLSGNGNLKWGEDFNESLLHIMENFADDTAPPTPIEGQLWFDSSSNTLSVYAAAGSPTGWQSIASGASGYTKAQIDSLFVAVDGTNPDMTGALILNTGSPLLPLQATPKQYVDAAVAAVAASAETVPPGTISMFGGTVAPSGYVLCDGTVYTQASQADLFVAISTNYNIGGELGSEFRVPDLQGRFPVGVNPLGVVVGRISGVSVMGALGGVEEVALDTTQMPAHAHILTINSGGGSHSHTGSTNTTGSHRHGNVLRIVGDCESGNGDREPGTGGNTDYAGDHSHTVTVNSTNINHVHTGSAASIGGGLPHTNTPPYQVVNYIIKT